MGHDYSLGLPGMLDGYIWFKNNGLSPPWFSPSFCAGQPFYADPQSGYYSLIQWLAFIVNPVMASYWTLLVSASLFYWGGYLLMRWIFGASRAVSVLVGGLLMFNGFLPYRAAVGHLGYTSFALLPWLALLLLVPLRRRIDSLATSIAAGLLLAYWVHGGLGTLMIPAGMGVLLVALLYGLQDGNLSAFLIRSTIASITGLLVSAAKLIAAGSLLANLPRDFYPLPGAHSFFDAHIMVLASLFLPSETVFAIMTPRLSNLKWSLLPHEWAFGFTPAPAILILSLMAILFARGEMIIPRRWRSWLLVAMLFGCLFWPIAFNTYEPVWNAFLKSLPVLGSASTPTRWMVLYIPFVAVAAGLLLQKRPWTEPMRWLVTIVTLGWTVALTALEPRDYYLQQDYDARPVLLMDALVRTGKIEPHISEIGNKAKLNIGNFEKELESNDTFLAGVSKVFCYNPIFGYRLEKFSAEGLMTGSVFQEKDGYLNLKNPACYVFPKENDCKPGDRFRVEQIEAVKSFVEYRPFAFNISTRQRAGNAVTEWSLWVIGFLAVIWSGWRIHLFIRARKHI